jgi:hypothetical protein
MCWWRGFAQVGWCEYAGVSNLGCFIGKLRAGGTKRCVGDVVVHKWVSVGMQYEGISVLN